MARTKKWKNAPPSEARKLKAQKLQALKNLGQKVANCEFLVSEIQDMFPIFVKFGFKINPGFAHKAGSVKAKLLAEFAKVEANVHVQNDTAGSTFFEELSRMGIYPVETPWFPQNPRTPEWKEYPTYASSHDKILMKNETRAQTTLFKESVNVLILDDEKKMVMIMSSKYTMAKLSVNRSTDVESQAILDMLKSSIEARDALSLNHAHQIMTLKTIKKMNDHLKHHHWAVRRYLEDPQNPPVPKESDENFSKEAFKFNEKIWAIRKSATVMVSPEEMKEAVEAVKAHDKIWAQVSIFLSENDPLWKQCSISIPETPMPANEWGNLCKKWHKSLQQTLKQTKTSAKEKLRSKPVENQNKVQPPRHPRPFNSKELAKRKFESKKFMSSDHYMTMKKHNLALIELPDPHEMIHQQEWMNKFHSAMTAIDRVIDEFNKDQQYKKDLVARIMDFKNDPVYQQVSRGWIDPPRTPDLRDTDSSIAYLSYKSWKGAYQQRYEELKDSLNHSDDILAVKNSSLYQEYYHRYLDDEVQRVKTPDIARSSPSDKQSQIDLWKAALSSVLKHRKRAHSSSAYDFAYGTPSKKSHKDNLKETPFAGGHSNYETGSLSGYGAGTRLIHGASTQPAYPTNAHPGFRAGALPTSSGHFDVTEGPIAGVNFNLIVRMEPQIELISYIQTIAPYYARLMENKNYEAKIMIEDLSSGSEGFTPCGYFNKDNSCQTKFLHPDGTIHICALCYYSLGGMMNVHRLSQCPLLNLG